MSAPTQSIPAGRRPHSVRRLGALAVLAVVSLGAGLVVGARQETPEERLAVDWAHAWERGDYGAMYAMVTPEVRRSRSLRAFVGAYRRTASTATLTHMRTGRPQVRRGRVLMTVAAQTRIFGELGADVALELAREPGGEPRVAWRPELLFPGLRRREHLRRETRMPPRATIEARDGTPLARGDARLSDLGPVAAEVAGRIGPAPAERAAELAGRGVPPGAPVGLTGLERQFDAQLSGTPGGVLRAGDRVLASRLPIPGTTVRTTIDPAIQRAAVTALAGRFGGVAAVRPRNGEVLALAGIAYSAPQPPGSVFKIVTLAGALESGVTRPSATFPVQTAATLEGVELRNAHGEACGGSLTTAFARSCNSVFAPLGARLGARRLVAAAERFGFNEEPGVSGAARATIPAAAEIGDDLALGSTAIGQGKVLSTPLHMALVAAAVGERGRRPRAVLLRGQRRPAVRATTPRVARTVARAMRAVVTSGTGVGADIPGAHVAGKTGTAELRSTVSADPQPPDRDEPQPEEDVTDTDAWFAAFAPMRHPKVAVGVLLVAQGAGGDTAAPAARIVLQAALAR